MKTIRKVLLACLVAAGCTTAHAAAPVADPMAMQDAVLVNGRAVAVGMRRNLVELLQGQVEMYRLGLVGNPVRHALVVVNGTVVSDGPGMLRLISSRDVESVTTMVPLDAVTRYGANGGNGAILITTRGSRLPKR